MFNFTGMRVFVDDSLGQEHKQIKFPRSKKKRIQNKWSKNLKNWELVYKEEIYIMGQDIICDPITYQKIRKEFGEI